jgi:hypothetical protein
VRFEPMPRICELGSAQAEPRPRIQLHLHPKRPGQQAGAFGVCGFLRRQSAASGIPFRSAGPFHCPRNVGPAPKEPFSRSGSLPIR